MATEVQEEAEEREARKTKKKKKEAIQFLGLENERPAVITRAEQMLTRLGQAGLTWDKQGVVRYPDSVLDHEANIADLVHDAVTYQKQKPYLPEGWEKFYNFVQVIHLTHMVLGAQARRDWFGKIKAAQRSAHDLTQEALRQAEDDDSEVESGNEMPSGKASHMIDRATFNKHLETGFDK